MSAWATVNDFTAAHPGAQASDYDLELASRVIASVLWGGRFDPSDRDTSKALTDATVAQAWATHVTEERRTAAPTVDRLTSAKIGSASYTLSTDTTPESAATRLTAEGVSIDALAILQQAGLLPVIPWLEG